MGRLRASRPRVSVVETSDVRSCALRWAQHFCCQAFQTLIRPWVAQPSFDRAYVVIAASLRRELWGERGFGRLRASRPMVSVVETSDVLSCALRCAQRLLPGVADSHTVFCSIATLRSSDLGDCDVPPVRAVCGVGRGSFASRPRVGVVWRCPTGASVHSAALSACCQAWQTRTRP